VDLDGRIVFAQSDFPGAVYRHQYNSSVHRVRLG